MKKITVIPFILIVLLVTAHAQDVSNEEGWLQKEFLDFPSVSGDRLVFRHISGRCAPKMEESNKNNYFNTKNLKQISPEKISEFRKKFRDFALQISEQKDINKIKKFDYFLAHFDEYFHTVDSGKTRMALLLGAADYLELDPFEKSTYHSQPVRRKDEGMKEFRRRKHEYKQLKRKYGGSIPSTPNRFMQLENVLLRGTDISNPSLCSPRSNAIYAVHSKFKDSQLSEQQEAISSSNKKILFQSDSSFSPSNDSNHSIRSGTLEK